MCPPADSASEPCIHGSFNVTLCISNPSRIAYFRPRVQVDGKNRSENKHLSHSQRDSEMFTIKREWKGPVSARFLLQICRMSVPRTATVNSERAAHPLRACSVPAPCRATTCAQSAYYAQTGPESCINSRFHAYIYEAFLSFPAVLMLSEKWRVSRMACFSVFLLYSVRFGRHCEKEFILSCLLWFGFNFIRYYKRYASLAK